MTSSPETRLIEVQRLGVVYDDGADAAALHALQGVTFDVSAQEFVALIGPSGCGKSTLLRVLAGLVPPTQGRIIFHRDSPKIGMVFQQANLMPWRNVLDNIALPLVLEGMPLLSARQRALEMIHLVGLDGFGNALPRDLSGGMAQRVAIARALIHDPDLLLLDEPFAALDALTREKMWNELLHIWQKKRKTVLMVTHSISEALFLADRVLVLTRRPGSIKRVLRVPLPRPRDESMRYTPEFGELAHMLKQAIE